MHFPAEFWNTYTPFFATFLLLLVLFIFLRNARNNLLSLPEIEPISATKPADCMVVIPARNEEFTIERAVKSLPSDSVIVVDDASTDRTATVAREAGAGVLPAPKLGFGVWGKPSACAEGARVLTSRWILFADADTWFERGFLEAAVSSAETEKIEFVSIILKPEYESAFMRVLGPVATALYYAGFERGSDRADMFLGHCVLVRRHPYEFIGGHRALVKFIDEDLQLAALAKRHRLRYAVARAPRLGHVRVLASDFIRAAYRYEGPRAWTGLRILLAGLCCALWFPLMAWLIVLRLYPAATVLALGPIAMFQTWYRWPAALLAPLGMFTVLPILLRGAWDAFTGRTLHWKGREL